MSNLKKKRAYRVRQGSEISYSDGKTYPSGSTIYLTIDEVNIKFWRDVEIPDKRHRQDLEMKVNEEYRNYRREAMMQKAIAKGIDPDTVEDYLRSH
jgi:hypothetical protein